MGFWKVDHRHIIWKIRRGGGEALQKLQNRAARLVARSRIFCHVTPLLTVLHWLPVPQRVKFKMLLYDTSVVGLISDNDERGDTGGR